MKFKILLILTISVVTILISLRSKNNSQIKNTSMVTPSTTVYPPIESN